MSQNSTITQIIHKLQKAITRLNINNILISGLKEKLDIFRVNAEKENKVIATGKNMIYLGKRQKRKRLNTKTI